MLLISEIRLYREGLAEILGRDPRLEVIASSSVRSAPALLAGVAVVLLDAGAAGGCEWARRATADPKSPPIVAFAVGDVESDLLPRARAGIVAFVPPDATLEELVSILARAARGEAVCSPTMTAVLLRRLAALEAGGHASGAPPLTPREHEILELVAGRCSNKEIAARLHVSTSTVKNHMHHILDKLQLRSRHEAAAWTRRYRDPTTAER